jgi:hypothetical protein
MGGYNEITAGVPGRRFTPDAIHLTGFNLRDLAIGQDPSGGLSR